MKHSTRFISKLFEEMEALREVAQTERDSVTALLQLAAEESVEVSQACHKLLRIYDAKEAKEAGENPRLRRCRKSEEEAYLNLIFELLDFEAVLSMALDQMEIPKGLSEYDIVEVGMRYTRHKIARNHGEDIPEPTLDDFAS